MFHNNGDTMVTKKQNIHVKSRDSCKFNTQYIENVLFSNLYMITNMTLKFFLIG
ncbi:hypothetical protein JHK82_044344 [Glycine max]|uniref:Uncharacterized protein n=2 Tax=Glycine subgen. Soja TaxID=1462606 RepID=K7MFU1_SOYBN|nr:hypothetical protein JHK86_044692 [Glycine max]KAG4940664.1 hypothetical protein JHK87_044535 [Glycine soja]KAG4951436.1 hypothetical protein JHK85_045303 [Glycine max]KAG5099292.1 hypothetical protein JHK82_044344 [Glycine max]KAH1150468.1 hypothetical protein GYH30_044464 [Glycine max]